MNASKFNVPAVNLLPLLFLLIALTGFVSLPSALAVSASWSGATSSLWATTTNWSASPVPGAGDTATFSGAGNGNTTLDLGGGVQLLSMTFTSGSAAAYTIGSGGVGAQTLTLLTSGTTQLAATVANNQLINSNILLGVDATASSYTFTNSSTTNGLTLAGSMSGNTGGTAAAKTVTFNGAGAKTVSGVISNGGASVVSLTSSAGTTTLSGNNSYSGSTTVSAGVLTLSGSNTTTGNTTLNGATATLNLGNANALGSSGTLTLTSGTLNNTSLASLTLSGNNPVVIGGNFTFGGSNNLNMGMTTLSTAQQSFTITLNGVGSILTFGGTLAQSNTGNPNYTVNGAGNKLVLGGHTVSSGVTGRTVRFLGDANVEITDAVTNGTSSNVALVNAGTGLLLLTGSSSYSGGTQITSTGTVQIGNSGTTGSTIGAVSVASGGTLVYDRTDAITVTGGLSGAGTVRQQGGSSLTLSANSSFTGGLIISSGTVISNTTGFGNGGPLGMGTITLANNTVLNLNGFSAVNTGLNTSGNGTGALVTSGTTGLSTFSIGSTNFSSTTSSTYAGTITNGSGTLAITKVGTGTFTLTGSNSYSGATTVSGGALAIGNNNALGSGTMIISNATVQSDSSTARVLSNAVTIGSTSGTFGAGGDLTFGSMTLSGDRTVNVQNSITTVANSLNDGSARTLTKSGTGSLVVTGSAAHGGSIVTAGVLAVTGTYSSTGNMNVQGGVLGLNSTLTRNLGSAASQVQLTAGNSGFAATGTNATWGNAANNLLVAIGGTAAPTALTFGGTSTFLASGQTLVLGAAISNGTVTFANSLNLANATQTIQVNRSTATGAGTDAIISGTISNGSLTKTGAGILALTANNTYAGTTTVSLGTLVINGSQNSSPVIVQSGGVLSGTGTVGNLTVQSGGTLAPGNSPGIINSGSFSLNSGATLVMEITGSNTSPVAGTHYDQVNVTGDVTLGGALSLSLAGYTHVLDSVFFLVNNDVSDAVSGVFSNANFNTSTIFTLNGQDWRINYNANSGTTNAGNFTSSLGNDVALLAVPEPSTCLLVGLGLAFTLLRIRSRARRHG